MKVKALTSFVGRISMNIDDEREIIDKELAKDLIRAGYVAKIKEVETTEEVEETIEETETTEEVETPTNKNKRNKK